MSVALKSVSLSVSTTVETRYNEHANNEFNRYDEHNFASADVKIVLYAINAYNEFIVITYEFPGSLEHSLYRVFTVNTTITLISIQYERLSST